MVENPSPAAVLLKGSSLFGAIILHIYCRKFQYIIISSPFAMVVFQADTCTIIIKQRADNLTIETGDLH
jgi:hypothetical protein